MMCSTSTSHVLSQSLWIRIFLIVHILIVLLSLVFTSRRFPIFELKLIENYFVSIARMSTSVIIYMFLPILLKQREYIWSYLGASFAGKANSHYIIFGSKKNILNRILSQTRDPFVAEIAVAMNSLPLSK